MPGTDTIRPTQPGYR